MQLFQLGGGKREREVSSCERERGEREREIERGFQSWRDGRREREGSFPGVEGTSSGRAL